MGRGLREGWLFRGLGLAVAAVAAGAVLSAPPQAPPKTAAASDAQTECPIQFQDVTRETGIAFVHADGSSGKRYVFEPMASGVAVLDYNNDGRQDIYFLTGTPLRGTKTDVPPKNRLYRNDGGLRFADVTDQAGVGHAGYGLAVAVGDYNNDGHLDIYVNNFGDSVLYRNNGDGTFTDVAKEAGVVCPDKVGAGTSFLDIDEDGFLDLFVAHYVKWSYETHVSRPQLGHPIYSGPRDYPKTVNTLYRNNRDGTFKDVSVESGIAAHLGAGMGCVCADYDNDGHTDILVANDEWPNFLFRNSGNGKFEEVALLSGIAFSADGSRKGSMGAACGDYDNDGRLDFHITSYQGEMATLYRNLGNGLFEDVTHRTGGGEGTRPYVTWGNGLADLDNDGHKDIFMVCGHLNDNIELIDDTTSYLASPIVLRNTGSGRFANVSRQAGLAAMKLCGRGIALADLDNDGKVDVAILNSRRPATILKNVSKNSNHWIQIDLRGVKTNRFGVGAHVKVVAGDLAQLDEVHSGQGYQSHFGMRLHFGLGQHDRIDRIEVRWIGGGVDVFENVRVDQVLTLTEGTGRPGALAPAASPGK
jgi:hypothetical protein